MPTFTIHQPPPRKDEAVAAPERFVFVRDGFYFWAFVLPPLWLLLHGLWLVLVGYFIVNFAFGVLLFVAGVSATMKFLAGFLVALLMGFEAPSLWRWTLARRGWKTLGFVVGDKAEMAERRFYAEWSNRAAEPAAAVPQAAAPPPLYGSAMRRGPPSGHDVIGLFPEPGGQR
jgi:hypothetical protein